MKCWMSVPLCGCVSRSTSDAPSPRPELPAEQAESLTLLYLAFSGRSARF